jgi:protein TonB
MKWALAAAASLHAAAVALLVLDGTPRPLGTAGEEPAGIIAVFSEGGGGEEAGRIAEDLSAEEAAAAPADPPAEPGEMATAPVAEDAPPEQVTAEAPPAEPVPEPAEDERPFTEAALPLPPPSPPEPPPPPRQALRAAPASAPTTRGEISATAAPAGEGEEARMASAATAGQLTALREATVGRRVDPVWPIEARRARMQGTVVLAVTISPEGVPAAVDVLRSSGHFMLDRAAQEALWQWRFDPARRGGVPVQDRVAIPITFRLTD